MNVETAVAAVRNALAGITGFPAVMMRMVTADDAAKTGGLGFPICALIRTTRTRETRDARRIYDSTIDLECYVFIDESEDTLAEELDRISDLVDDAIWDLDLTSGDGLNCWVES